MRRAAAVILLCAATFGCAHGGAPAAPVSSPSRLLNEPLPTFRRPTLQGGTFDTTAAAGPGQVVVVDFFAAYCKPCQRTLPALEALHRRQPGLTIIGVSLDDTPDNAWKSVRRHRLTFPVIHDAGNVLAGRMRVTELPISFVIDGEGRVRWVGGPDQPDDALERAIAAITTPSP